jgi:hypothetical protein
MILKEVVREDVDWINQAQVIVQSYSLVSTIMNLRVS